MDVRKAAPSDLDAVLELERAAFGDDAWTRTAVQEELTAGARTPLVVGDPPRGWASILVAGDDADLTRIGVHPTARRTGCATALLVRAHDEARSRGATRMLLEVSPQNHAAVALYTADGFALVARRTAYYADGSDALVLERAL
ncbi:GNAT family N-acetyltransferase [Aeromicrobium sp. CTD01-1L150]|uniref:GNAT family N-acetyltransferase n=1 Tax=Aeromicrobium sp. CTD01-1L150 TaxID=3341830 RepID=UPI0035BF7B58